MKLSDRFGALALCCALVLLAAAGTAPEPRDRLFRAGALEPLPAGTVLTFTRSRAVPPGADPGAIPDGRLTIEVSASADGSGTVAGVSFDEADRQVVLPPAPTSAGHPVLLVFLESTVNSLARIAGGSPFYIRNRFIEAFDEPSAVEPLVVGVAGTEVAGERLTFRPFEADPNRERMGALAELELRFVLSQEVPGGLVSATATAGEFSHVITLQGTEVAE